MISLVIKLADTDAGGTFKQWQTESISQGKSGRRINFKTCCYGIVVVDKEES